MWQYFANKSCELHWKTLKTAIKRAKPIKHVSQLKPAIVIFIVTFFQSKFFFPTLTDSLNFLHHCSSSATEQIIDSLIRFTISRARVSLTLLCSNRLSQSVALFVARVFFLTGKISFQYAEHVSPNPSLTRDIPKMYTLCVIVIVAVALFFKHRRCDGEKFM